MSSAVASGSGGSPPDKPPSFSKDGDSKPYFKKRKRSKKSKKSKKGRKRRRKAPVYFCTVCEGFGLFSYPCIYDCPGRYFLQNRRSIIGHGDMRANCDFCGELGRYGRQCEPCSVGCYRVPPEPEDQPFIYIYRCYSSDSE